MCFELKKIELNWILNGAGLDRIGLDFILFGVACLLVALAFVE